MNRSLNKSKRTEFALHLDHYLCGALVFLCTLIKPVFARFRPFRPSEVKEIVVAKYVGLGSILLTQKLLKAIRRNFPDARITFLTFDLNERLLGLMGDLVDEVLTVRTTPSAAVVASTFKAVSILRKRGVDLFLDIEFFSRYSAMMCFLSRPRTSVGYESLLLRSRTVLYSHPAKFIPQAHIAENFVNHLRTLGIAVDPRESYVPSIRLPRETAAKAAEKIAALGLKPGGFLIFNPNASDALGGYRKWPAEKWAELARDVMAKTSLLIVFTGLKTDAKNIEAILSGIGAVSGRVIGLAGKLDLDEYLTLISMSRLVVTVDSGPSHFAAALDKPTVTLFGPEWPGLYGYDGPRCRIVYKRLFCSPCYNIHYGKKIVCHNENRCMTTITSAEVLQAVDELLLQHA